MGKIVVKIAAPGAISAGMADYQMLAPLVGDLVVLDTGVTSGAVCGGVLPITQATATLLGI